ncbi:related to malonyl CoA synthetase [Phialocephala subalpina]|uniref:Related to malonyl CoA synthetase n=1 Tax=Phialocephala subalpina TaxID=576137 RepID=A0A1L7WTD3_9HELO|nr:related to malonyl CoA synthetase [Phialocephala subalpina]
MAPTLPRLPIFEAIANHDPNSTVVVHSASGRRFTYGELLHDVAERKDSLLQESGKSGIGGERIAFLVENSYDYVVTLLSILGTHSIALPLSPAFPPHELQYIMDQSGASMLLSSGKFEIKALDVYKEGLQGTPKHVKLEKKLGGGEHAEVKLEGPSEGPGGMMLYTSGTTNRPKGVLLPTSAMTAQAKSLITAWDYCPTDYLLHVLPLHHIHGTINAIFAPLFAGSTIEFLFPFNATAVWNRFATPFLPTTNGQVNGHTEAQTNGHTQIKPSPITFFTVVPTVYNRLLASFPQLSSASQTAAREAISPKHLRLNISGSAALPTPTKAAWSTLSSGNILLERYGMTEVGMALSCGLPFSTRVDGSVGWPLPGVEARLYETETNSIILPGEEINPKTGRERDGEIQLRGPGLFLEYWGNEVATKKEHLEGEDGKGRWFRTGDVAVRRFVPGVSDRKPENESEEWCKGPMYFIHGRLSSDIIKSGGEKVSALEVERELLSLPQVLEAAVVAVPSGNWGQKVGCVLVLREPKVGGRKEGIWGPLDMRRALKGRLAGYKIPQVMKVVEGIERNAMGKVNKKVLVKKLFTEEMSGDEKDL